MSTVQMQTIAAMGSQSLRQVRGGGGGASRRAFAGQQLRQPARNGSRCRAFFNFNKKKDDSRPASDSAYWKPQSRDDYTADEVKEYFSYMGMLAEDGSYDRCDSMIASGTHPADLMLLMAAQENDDGKVAELLAAGADPTVTDDKGRTPLELASKEEVKSLLQQKLASV